MLGTVRLAISSKIGDRDDFKRLTLVSDNADEIHFYRNRAGGFVCEFDSSQTNLPEKDIYDRIEDFIQKGFRSITCQCYSGNVNITIPSQGRGQVKISYSQYPSTVSVNEKGYLIDPDEANKLLEAIEIATLDGSIRADMKRKYVQIDSFVKLIEPLFTERFQKGKIHILDCGSGKSYLSYAMNYFLREKMHKNCHFYCVDTNADVIDKCIRIQEQIGYENMEFHVSKIKDFSPKEKVNLVCSLHACDTASDEAIAKGINLEAPFLLIVPCCQHEVINQLKEHPLKAITRHGVYKAKLADLLTDAMRTLILEAAGYKVSVTEYISPIYTPKNIMIQAEKVQGRNKMAMNQYLELRNMFGDMDIELEKMLPDMFS